MCEGVRLIIFAFLLEVQFAITSRAALTTFEYLIAVSAAAHFYPFVKSFFEYSYKNFEKNKDFPNEKSLTK